jgi:zinc/manganese transport system substrate-binding protein
MRWAATRGSSRAAVVLPVAVLLGTVLLGTTACATAAGSTDPRVVRVVASTNVWGNVASTVGGRHAQVTSLITDPAADPHEYEASARTRLAVSRADVVVENGGGYDDFLRRLVDAPGTRAQVVDAVDVSGAAARAKAAGTELNEHVWYDLSSVGQVAGRLAAALAEADPRDAPSFRANAASFQDRLRQLADQVRADRAATDGAPVAITEPVPLYLLDALGAVDKTPAAFSQAVEEGDDVPVTVLRQTLALFSDRAVRALVYNAQTADPQTALVTKAARDAGVAVVPVTEILPPRTSYLRWMTGNVRAISEALR